MEQRQWLVVFFGALVLTFIFYIAGNALLAILTILVGAWSYIPLTGDSQNSDTLLRELKRVLSAKDTRPKAESAASSSTARTTATARPTTSPSPFGSAQSSSSPKSSPSASKSTRK